DDGTLSGICRGGRDHPFPRGAAREDRRRDSRRRGAASRADDKRRRRAAGAHAMTAPLRHPEPTIVRVSLAERSYDIAIGRGLLARLGSRIAALRPGAAAAIVTDETVARHHLAAAEAALAAAGVRGMRVVVPAGESTKSWPMLERVCDALLAQRMERR